MDITQANRKLIDDLRAWFFAKDRSISLAQSCLYYLFVGGQANGAYMSMAFIAEIALSANSASITFSNIPQDFRHLMLFCSAKSSAAQEQDILLMIINGDTGNNYDRERIEANSTTLSSAAARATPSITLGLTEAANSRNNCFAPTWGVILNYSIPTIEKYTLELSGNIGDLSAATDLFMRLSFHHWRNRTVISSLTFLPNTGPNFVSGSRFYLYGIL